MEVQNEKEITETKISIATNTKRTYVYEKVPLSKRKYNVAYQKVPLPIGKNLCL